MPKATNWRRLAAVALTAVCVGPLALFAAAKGCVALDGASIDEGETVAVWVTDPDAKPHGGYWAGNYHVEEVLADGRLKVARPGKPATVVSASEVEPINRWGGE